MWSDPDSGFEANPYSPAGRMQRQWWFLRRAARLSDQELAERTAWAFRSALPVMLAVAVLAVSMAVLSRFVPIGFAVGAVTFVAVLWVMRHSE
jgi:hypothetical protein